MKKIFLTGASSGIGRATAEALTSAGHEVWGTARDVSRLPALHGLHPLALDLLDPDSIESSFCAAVKDAGGFDVLINNAGSGHFGPTEFQAREELEREFRVLVFGQIHLIQLALPTMRARRSGLIINISSLASRLPLPFMSSYSAGKAALATFSLALNLELQNCGVRVVDLQPADIRTKFNDAVTQVPNESSDYTERVAQTWKVAEKNLQNAPPPELVAHHILRVIDSNNPPPRLTVGDFFQSRFAPFMLRFLPVRTQLWGLRKYYGI
ncbi:MAG: SDR family oxidoreductase [Chthoniobacterales bacterium]